MKRISALSPDGGRHTGRLPPPQSGPGQGDQLGRHSSAVRYDGQIRERLKDRYGRCRCEARGGELLSNRPEDQEMAV